MLNDSFTYPQCRFLLSWSLCRKSWRQSTSICLYLLQKPLLWSESVAHRWWWSEYQDCFPTLYPHKTTWETESEHYILDRNINEHLKFDELNIWFPLTSVGCKKHCILTFNRLKQRQMIQPSSFSTIFNIFKCIFNSLLQYFECACDTKWMHLNTILQVINTCLIRQR